MASPKCPPVFDEKIGALPFGLMRLSEMINYQCFGLVHLTVMLREKEEAFGNAANAAPHTRVSDERVADVRQLLEILTREGTRLEFEGAAQRAVNFTQRLRTPIMNEELCIEFRVMREAVEGEIHYKYFYHYPKREAERLLKVEADWSRIFDKFPAARIDATAAVDAWALANGTGCVFHCMRVAEIGLRALARDRRVQLKKDRPLEFAQWQDIIKATETEAEKIANWPVKRASARERALTFYRGALGELHAFKEVRNGVMHSRAHYDRPQAESVLNHVQGFMGRLAERLSDESKGQINWGR